MDKRTDINTASFAYSVSLLRIRISGYPPGAGTKRQSIHTAVLHGIAVFFCSTFFTTFHHYFISYDDFCHACASAFMQVLFLFVGKCRVVIYTSSLISSYNFKDYSFSKLRERYYEWNSSSMEEKNFESFGIVDGNGKLTNAGALLADNCPIRHSRLFCTRWNGLDKSGGRIDALDSAEFTLAS